MTFNNAGLVTGANGIRAAAVTMRLHSADPGVAGTSNPTTAAPQSITWTAASSSGNFALASPASFTGVAANGPCAYVSLWDLANTTWYGNFALSGDVTANSAGQFTVSTLTITGSAA